MTIESLAGRHILVVEDDYLIARDIRRELQRADAIVVGPVPSVAKAMRLLEDRPEIDAAVLDVNLDGDTSFPVARALQAMDIPFLFSTGYHSGDIPAEWRHVTVSPKPLRLASVAALLKAPGAA